MNFKTFKLIALSILAPTFAISSNAFADCSDMGNEQWNDLSAKMSQAYQAGNYEEAIKYGKSLTLICDRSPATNFVISSAYGQLGRDADGYNYIRKATDYLQEYNVPQAMTEKIWMRRAEYDLPYKKQVAELQAQLEVKDREMAAALAAGSEASSANLSASRNLYEDNMETIMWTGTGVAIGGAVIAIVGGVLAGYYGGEANDNLKKIYSMAKGNETNLDLGKLKHDYANSNDIARAGYATLGVGLGLGVAGAVTAVISYLKLEDMRAGDSNTETTVQDDSASVSFNVSMNSVSLGVTF